jgi:hypothetical protein
MRTLIYKRTHTKDPDPEGRFGIHDCMGPVRAWNFDAVIGVGGVGPEPRKLKLTDKVNWIGIGPHKKTAAGKRGPVVTFDHFVLWEAKGPSFSCLAPRLAERMYSNNVRVLMKDLNRVEQQEVMKILALAKHAPASRASRKTERPGRAPRKSIKGCST